MINLCRKMQRIHTDSLQRKAVMMIIIITSGGSVVAAVVAATPVSVTRHGIDSEFVGHVKESQGLFQHQRCPIYETRQPHIVQQDSRVVVEEGNLLVNSSRMKKRTAA
jgi:hypothetical protein